MTTDEVMAAVRELGCELVLRPDGTPIVRKADGCREVREPLLRVLRWHREEIIRRLKGGEARTP